MNKNFERNENPKILQNKNVNPFIMKQIDSKSIVSLAWFGLWGKTPAKQPDAPLNVASDNIVAPSDISEAVNKDTNPIPTSTEEIDFSAGYIPEPPPIVDENIILNALGEPTLNSLGLASSWTPVGWIQSLLEILHVDLGLPWFEAIALFAIVLRTCLFPITIKSHRSAAKMRKIGPEMTLMNEKLKDAKATGNSLEGFILFYVIMVLRKLISILKWQE